MNRTERKRLLAGMVAAAADAGKLAYDLAAAGVTARTKEDHSPVTEADEAAEALIAKRLEALLPGVPMIAEEAVAGGSKTKTGGMFFLVDPIDGTREYIAGRSEYTVNIALLIDETPALGVIYAPAMNELYAGGDGGVFRMSLAPGAAIDGAPRTEIRVRPRPKQIVATMSRSHLDPATQAWLKQYSVSDSLKIGSSIKFARVAEGAADIYPRLAPVSEWDIAAGHAILMAAGGSVRAPDGTPLRYGKRKEGYGVESFVAWGGAPA